MESVAHDGRETPIQVVDDGDEDPTALYVHGSGGTHQVWARQYGPDRAVDAAAALDLAGHGEAPDVDEDVDAMAHYVDDVVAAAEAVEADLLVGNSLGGAVVQQAVLEDRVDPAGIVLAGTGAKLGVREDLRELLAEDFQTAIEVIHGEDMLFHDIGDELRNRSMETMREVGQRVVRRDFLTCHRFDVRDRLDEIEVPALAIVGEHDSLTPVGYHEYLAEEIPDGVLQVIEDAAHLAMLEQPNVFNEAVGDFADRVVDS